MAEYTNAQAMADRLIAKKGYAATVRAAGTDPDPVTGAGSAAGTTRTVQAVQTRIDYKVFAETLVQSGDRMLIFASEVLRGEKLVDGSAEWEIREVSHVKPDNASHVITKALVAG